MVFGASSKASFIINTILIILIVAYFVYQGYVVWKRGRVAKVLDEEDFQEGMHKGQVIDLREKKDFDAGHILGARNIPYSTLKSRFQEVRPDLPVYIYDQGRSLSSRAAIFLAKKSYKQLFILRYGFQRWNGKTKKKD
ncbi:MULTISPECIES: rhodanese-like domain-containing protein [Pediococcus]|uniref:Rhodanese-like domain-containing protein n=1 Tax=Pediococcus parvulus TaxID=54062 RepID=A0A176TIZ7_9LACO|nr:MULTISPECIES: rhodanese-like domain-containing protein [Pediococcus]MCT3026307.1 rhodanese-like domain-containing protein [Pediococcus parvulus]MCT3028391.1 rhodanese-like domain-containing protein [Pediococcus parvulus]MCT3031528.1 rhodanese-like domain-containing protein [Pediococcus parvulus]MCT3035304.1 rhodanese-like domain-containing protein [Pediococcus parvulus]MDN5574749.1 rhodanese-like domain-containing protein [Pediococcus sp.]